MDKWVGCNPKDQLEVDMWHEKTILLTQLDPTGWDGGKERGKRKRKRKRRDFRERVSTLSLEFPVIGPSVLVGTIGEVGLRCKGYAWVPVLWSFDNSGRGFLLLGLVFV